MRPLFIAILIISFAGIALFGFGGMHHSVQHDSGCIAATVQGADCSTKENSSGYSVFHIDAFKNFALAAFGKNASARLLSLLLFFFVCIAFLLRSLPSSPGPSTLWRVTGYFLFPHPKQKFIRWLSLHENSPAIF